MVDHLVEFAEYDPELKKGIQWIDKDYLKDSNLDFYQKVYDILYRKEIHDKAKEWLNDRN